MNASTGPVRKWSVRLLDWLVWRPIAWCTRQCYRLTRWVLSPQVWLRLFTWLRFSSISLRRWLFIALLVLMLLPAIGAGMVAAGIALFVHQDFRPTATEEMLRNDTTWRTALEAQARSDEAHVVLYQDGEQVFRTAEVDLPFTGEDGDVITIVPNDANDQTAAISAVNEPVDNRFLSVPIAYFIFLALT